MKNQEAISQKIQRIQRRLDFKKDWFAEKILNLEDKQQKYIAKKGQLITDYQKLIAQHQ